MNEIDKNIIDEVDKACVGSIRKILDVYFNSVTDKTSQEDIVRNVMNVRRGISISLHSRKVLLDSLLSEKTQ